MGRGVLGRTIALALLAMGSVPLSMLEARLDQFIADGGVSPPGFNPALPEVAP
jgi:hypothetical protein